jgi:hypothetical protein
LENAFADGSSSHSVDYAGQSELRCHNDVPVGRMAACFGWATGSGFSFRQGRKGTNDPGVVAFQKRKQTLSRLPTDKSGIEFAFHSPLQNSPVTQNNGMADSFYAWIG